MNRSEKLEVRSWEIGALNLDLDLDLVCLTPRFMVPRRAHLNKGAFYEHFRNMLIINAGIFS